MGGSGTTARRPWVKDVQDVAEPGRRVDAVQAAGLHDAIDDGGALAGLVGARNNQLRSPRTCERRGKDRQCRGLAVATAGRQPPSCRPAAHNVRLMASGPASSGRAAFSSARSAGFIGAPADDLDTVQRDACLDHRPRLAPLPPRWFRSLLRSPPEVSARSARARQEIDTQLLVVHFGQSGCALCNFGRVLIILKYWIG